jgi:hypothetical protein
MNKWKIVQYYGWTENGKPLLPSMDNKAIATFKSYWRAWIYKFFHYDFAAESAYKTSFIWKIEKAKEIKR